ncbi:hypothetical protein EDI28_26090 [Photobacterium chitinilyticum]|uniref:Uncharacterized protein n=2 Tax=Photobacterium chitinilyticum TaxID=2485123 RepID=A0A3S3RXI4_9GAMM|nr:hypothetical protein EDI28_26090 [Photobacterium chitinilyticum]
MLVRKLIDKKVFMDFGEIIKVAAAILASLGGACAIIYKGSSFFGKLWADKLLEKVKSENAKELEKTKNELLSGTESYKVRLKKSEFIFEKQFEAGSHFSGLVAHLTPTPKTLLEAYDSYTDELALTGERCDDIIKSLEHFLCQYSAIVDEDTREKISVVIEDAVSARYKFRNNPHKLSNNEVNFINVKLREIEKLLISKFTAQISI